MVQENSSRLAAKANQLYWETSRPAGHLADELAISRSKFYALIEPLRVEVKCAACGSAVAFASRSDREAGRGRCPECGTEATVPVEIASRAAEQGHVERAATSEGSTGAWVGLPGTRELWLSAIAGVALGILATTFLRRR